MSNWISRLFGLSKDKPAPPERLIDVPVSSGIEVVDVPQDGSETLRLKHIADVNSLFYRWLIGQGALTQTTPNHLEKMLLETLDTLSKSELGGANLVPRVPAVIPQLLKSLRDENMSAAALSRQIAHDVLLVAEVIHDANSPYYHPAQPIHNIENAVILLGQNGLRLVIARVAFRPIINMQSGRFTKVVAPHIWSQSEKCADTCKMLAGEMRADAFEAFLAGLMQNVGMIVAFRMIDRSYEGPQLPDSDRFCFAFNQIARLLSARIAKHWDFPDNVVAALENLGKEAEVETNRTPLGRVLSMSDQISKIRMLVDAKQLQEDEYFAIGGMSPSALRCFQQLKVAANGVGDE
jgi:HD-like signal output (HDOD) protein